MESLVRTVSVVERHHTISSTYGKQLADIMQRAAALEKHARNQYHPLATTHPEYASWQRIERRYATIRGNAQHLLIVHQRRHYPKQPLYRLRKYLHLW
jgi:hypothetical protein